MRCNVLALALALALPATTVAEQLDGLGELRPATTATCAAGTSTVKSSTASDALPILFPTHHKYAKWDALTAVAHGALYACFVMDERVDLLRTSVHDITDPADSGPGLCMSLRANGAVFRGRAPGAKWLRYVNGDAEAAVDAPGSMSGWCDALVNGRHPPCDDDANCTGTWGLAGSSCVPFGSMTAEQIERAGALMVCEGDAETAQYLDIVQEEVYDK